MKKTNVAPGRDVAAKLEAKPGSFFDRARLLLDAKVPAGLDDLSIDAGFGEPVLNPEVWKSTGQRPSRRAAVLVPIIDRKEPTVLLTLRTADLASHGGQVAFPGGKIEPDDESPLAAALRETKEETGLAAGVIEPLGYLDLYLTFSGFRILPAVARAHPDFKLTLNPREVTDTFEVPLAYLMTPENLHRQTREWNGTARTYYAITYQNRFIWGITAGILQNLYDRVWTK